MWNYITTVFSLVTKLCSNTSQTNKGNSQMTNITNYIIVGLGVFLVSLLVVIYLNKNEIEALQEQVKNGAIAFEYQNAIIEQNRLKNAELSKELQEHLEAVKKNFSQVNTPNLTHREPKNECEIFIKDLARAYQR